MQNSAIARRSRLSGSSSKLSSLPFQKRLLNPTLSRPVWMRAEVVETAEDATVSGTIVGIRFVVLLRIAPRLVASSRVLRYTLSHPALPYRWYQAGPPTCVVTGRKFWGTRVGA